MKEPILTKFVDIVVPIYNEEKSVAATITSLQEICKGLNDYEFKIICVNDGSSDRTSEILDSLSNIYVVTHQVNRGYGAALKSGIGSSDAEWIFITDADSTYDLKDLVRLLEVSDGHDLVIGAREGLGISLNPMRRLARKVLRTLVYGLTGVMVPDLNSGLRIFRRSLYDDVKELLPQGFSFTTTITVAALHQGRPHKFISTQYKQRVGNSNINPIRDFFGFIMLIARVSTYFEPLKFFIPVTLMIFTLGVLRAIRDIWVNDSIGSLSILLIVMALQVFCTALLADVIVKRGKK
jgi:glycosyltransferase involved in cell wall biosynthesis